LLRINWLNYTGIAGSLVFFAAPISLLTGNKFSENREKFLDIFLFLRKMYGLSDDQFKNPNSNPT
jgi:hypothetical protein